MIITIIISESESSPKTLIASRTVFPPFLHLDKNWLEYDIHGEANSASTADIKYSHKSSTVWDILSDLQVSAVPGLELGV